MSVSDSSPYWVAETMIWNALEDTDLTAGGNLDLWRKQQNPIGNAGTNFKTGEIPFNPSSSDRPALMFGYADMETPEAERTHNAMDRIHGGIIIGWLNLQTHREADANKMIKRFQYLVEGTIGEAHRELLMTNSTYLPSGETNPIQDIIPGSPIFPNWANEDETPSFEFPILIRLALGSLWIR